MPDIKNYIQAFSKLNVNRSGDHASPHKPVMLLAVLALAEAGLLKENKIYYTQDLRDIFKSFFETVALPGDVCNPYFPFFHLYKGEAFWHLKPIAGREAIAEALSTVRGPAQITENFEYAFLDEELYKLISSPLNRDILRQALIDRWFPASREQIRTVAAEEQQIALYENCLKEPEKAAENCSSYSDKVRDAAFSRVVREAYDYRCAASGWRVILPDGSVMVEAAHIIPFSESRDNDPCNGIALAPSFHWALDKNILSPGPDLKWHVSKLLDKRNRDYQELLDLDKKPIILPRDKKYYPRMDALEKRLNKLVN
ncbi:MAG: HNH endonuclease [Deltaproteobacteria bacterium]|nr:HNH endonuclease [Deltaproteobacteria bacterium]